MGSRRSSLRAWLVAGILGAALCVVPPLAGQVRPGAAASVQPLGDWRYYGGDAGSQKYSPLDQINRDNVKNLRIAWRWKTDNFGPAPRVQPPGHAARGQRHSLHHGRHPSRRRRHRRRDRRNALDVTATTRAIGDARAPRQNHRGVAYWTDGRGDERILYITAGYHLIALNAKTGQPVASFGTAGVVDLLDGLDQPRPPNGQIGSSSPPMIVGDIAVVGAALLADRQDEGERRRRTSAATTCAPASASGSSTPIPRPGEFGNDTWENDSWSYTGNTGVWAPMSADPELGYVYLPVETPTNDFYGGHRPGNNLFAESLVCLDAKTGKRVWHFQFVHHGIWDYDTVAPPILLDITVNGRRIKAVAQVTKQAFTYVFDRVTGRAGVADRRAAGAAVGCAGREDVADPAVSDQARRRSIVRA